MLKSWYAIHEIADLGVVVNLILYVLFIEGWTLIATIQQLNMSPVFLNSQAP